MLIARAADREAALDLRGALGLYAAAIAADSSSVDAHLRYQQLSASIDGYSARGLRYARWMRSHDPLLRCFAIAAHVTPGHGADAARTLRALDSTTHPTPCSAAFIVILGRRGDILSRDVAAYARTVVAAAPISADAPIILSGILADSGDFIAARRLLTDGLTRTTRWQDSLLYRGALIGLARTRGDSAEVRVLRRLIEHTAFQDPRPGVRVHALLALGTDEHNSARADALFTDALEVPLHIRAWYRTTVDILGTMAARQIDRGEPRGAVDLLRRAIEIASREHDRPRLASAELRLGRALVKLDSLDAASRALQIARALADPADRYFVADVHHNLAHLYETHGTWRRAVASVNAFVAEAASFPNDPISVIALRDAGIIRAKAQEPVAARRALDSMVALIERQGANWLWAGEYYERAGELRRALAYYQRVSANNPSEAARALAGATRVYTVLGLTDSAAASARAHDAASPTPEEVPLMPAVLVQRHRAREATEIARRWRDRWHSAGNAAGDLRATLELASVLLDAGEPRAAIAEAHSARTLAAVQHDGEANAMAGLVEGRALVNLLDTSAARVLEQVIVPHGVAPPREIAAALHTARADAFRLTNQADSALRELETAASLVEEMTRVLDVDLDRARVRDHWVRPFDAALEILLSRPPSVARTAAVLAWSERRREIRDASARPEDLLLAVQRALRRDEALIDYVMLDSACAAIVVTRRDASVVALPTVGPRLIDMVMRFRRPMTSVFGGRIDTLRARLDVASASQLYRVLLAPVVAGTDQRKLRIIPDGVLQLVPFDALVTSTDGPPRFVLDDYEVDFLAAATPDRRPRLPRGRGTVVVLGEVPGGTTELGVVRSTHVRGAVEVIAGGRMPPAELLRRAAGAEVIHFATHAIVNASDPNASVLELGSQRAGGTLRPADLAHASLRARLVMLSGCETAAGPILRGAGAMSFSRAFLAASAEHVVATQWPIGEQAALLMPPFYRSLRDGATVASALRVAKRHVRASPGGSSPFVWAPFVATSRLIPSRHEISDALREPKR